MPKRARRSITKRTASSGTRCLATIYSLKVEQNSEGAGYVWLDELRPLGLRLQSKFSASLMRSMLVKQRRSSVATERIFGFNKLKFLRQTNDAFDQLYRAKVLIPHRRGLTPRAKLAPPTHFLNAEANEYDRIARLVPYQLPYDVRHDVIQSIFLAILEGSLQREQVKDRVKDYIRAHYREANRNGVGMYGMVSLDEPIRADSDLRLIDRITRNNWDGVPV